MRFPCLVLDHDDTVVNSTAVIHFPSFLAYLAQVRPGLSYTLDDYFRKNFDPGIIPLFKDELGFTDEELEGEYQFWQNWVATRVPEAYPGMREILDRYKARGGKIAVISHSVSDVIRRDYRENGLPEPDLIFGWELPPEHRKPHVWPLEQIMAEFQLAPDQLLMLDDLKPGYDMCRAFRIKDNCAYGTLPNGEQFIIDTDDIQRVSEIFWHMGKDGYIIYTKPGMDTIRLHNFTRD